MFSTQVGMRVEDGEGAGRHVGWEKRSDLPSVSSPSLFNASMGLFTVCIPLLTACFYPLIPGDPTSSTKDLNRLRGVAPLVRAAVHSLSDMQAILQDFKFSSCGLLSAFNQAARFPSTHPSHSSESPLPMHPPRRPSGPTSRVGNPLDAPTATGLTSRSINENYQCFPALFSREFEDKLLWALPYIPEMLFLAAYGGIPDGVPYWMMEFDVQFTGNLTELLEYFGPLQEDILMHPLWGDKYDRNNNWAHCVGKNQRGEDENGRDGNWRRRGER